MSPLSPPWPPEREPCKAAHVNDGQMAADADACHRLRMTGPALPAPARVSRGRRRRAWAARPRPGWFPRTVHRQYAFPALRRNGELPVFTRAGVTTAPAGGGAGGGRAHLPAVRFRALALSPRRRGHPAARERAREPGRHGSGQLTQVTGGKHASGDGNHRRDGVPVTLAEGICGIAPYHVNWVHRNR